MRPSEFQTNDPVRIQRSILNFVKSAAPWAEEFQNHDNLPALQVTRLDGRVYEIHVSVIDVTDEDKLEPPQRTAPTCDESAQSLNPTSSGDRLIKIDRL